MLSVLPEHAHASYRIHHNRIAHHFALSLQPVHEIRVRRQEDIVRRTALDLLRKASRGAGHPADRHPGTPPFKALREFRLQVRQVSSCRHRQCCLSHTGDLKSKC